MDLRIQVLIRIMSLLAKEVEGKSECEVVFDEKSKTFGIRDLETTTKISIEDYKRDKAANFMECIRWLDSVIGDDYKATLVSTSGIIDDGILISSASFPPDIIKNKLDKLEVSDEEAQQISKLNMRLVSNGSGPAELHIKGDYEIPGLKDYLLKIIDVQIIKEDDGSTESEDDKGFKFPIFKNFNIFGKDKDVKINTDKNDDSQDNPRELNEDKSEINSLLGAIADDVKTILNDEQVKKFKENAILASTTLSLYHHMFGDSSLDGINMYTEGYNLNWDIIRRNMIRITDTNFSLEHSMLDNAYITSTASSAFLAGYSQRFEPPINQELVCSGKNKKEFDKIFEEYFKYNNINFFNPNTEFEIFLDRGQVTKTYFIRYDAYVMIIGVNDKSEKVFMYRQLERYNYSDSYCGTLKSGVNRFLKDLDKISGKTEQNIKNEENKLSWGLDSEI